MNPTLQALQFANLLDMASLSAIDGEAYKKQEELIEIFRQRKQPFLATMPMRHRTKCEMCRVERGDSIFHFENPQVNNTAKDEAIMWGSPVGIWVQVETEELHNVLAHGVEPSLKLNNVLHSVKC